MRQPVEAVALHTVPPGQINGDRVPRCPLRHLPVEGGVEGRHDGDVGTQGGLRGADGAQRRPIVQGRQLAQALDGVDDLLVDQHRFHKAVAAVDDPVADGVDTVPSREADFGQPFQHAAGRLTVIRQGGLLEQPSPLGGELDGALATDAVDDASREQALPLFPDKPELKRGASAVDGEYVHRHRTRRLIARAWRWALPYNTSAARSPSSSPLESVLGVIG